MRLMFVLAMVLGAACGGGGDDPHEVVPCSDYGQVTHCESACEPRLGSDALGHGSCSAIDPRDDEQYACPDTAEVDGVRGCCQLGAGGDSVVKFYECE